jgi:hypothetical protein
VNIHKLILNGTPDDGGRLEWFCHRLSPIEFAGSGRLRMLAVELARRQELDVSAIAYEDEMLEIEVVIVGDRFREPVSISRDRTGDCCQVSWQRWADIGDDTTIGQTVLMIAAISGTCAAAS